MAEIDQMITDGQLERVPADSSAAAGWLADSERHLRAADTIVDIDPSGAFALAYDAARKACAALLLVQGLRVKAVPGSHRALIESAAGLIKNRDKRVQVERLDRMRRNRNQSEYGSRSFSVSEIEAAIRQASEVVDLAKRTTGL